jgi:Ca2+-binding EF-hand superfamily protein
MSSESRPSYSGEQLLLSLERAFAQHAGADGVIDLQDLRRSLGLKSEYLVRRVLAAFDLDADGLIQKEEFLAGVRRLFSVATATSNSSPGAHDHNDDGFSTKSSSG